MRKQVLSLVVALFAAAPVSLFAQASACPAVTASPDVTVCAGSCTTLTSTIQGSVGTSTYTTGAIPYNPYSYTTGTQVLINIDDTWTPVIPLPFCFEFFGNTYNQMVIGSNGILSFNTSLAGGFCQWQITGSSPNTSAYDQCIMAPYQDIDPSIGSSSDVRYQIYGTSPCREFVVSWYNVPMYSSSCNSLLASSQVVLHETTNIIDIYIANKPLCSSWNAGAAIEGIVNPGATLAYITAGRNYPTQWTAVNDGQRWVPSGAPNYTVQWSGPSGPLGTSTSQQVCPTVTSTYTVTVTNTTCSSPIVVSDQVTVNIGPGSLSTTSASSSPTCNGGCNGSATVTPSGGTLPYTYSWAPSGGTGPTATGLCAGAYTCTITESGGCTNTTVVNVTQPAPVTATMSTTPAACTSNNGTATAAASGGTGGYTYSWAPTGGTGATATGLAPGNYTVTVTDANGCSTTNTVAVTNASANLTATTASTNATCAGNDGTASVNTSGGTAPYTYSWSPSGGTGSTATGLAPGTYTVTITDVNGCSHIDSVTVGSSGSVTASVTSVIDVTCNGSANGSITATTSTGLAPFTYSWSPSGGSGATASNLTAGTYTCTITDANGCSTTVIGTVSQPAAVTATPSQTNITCNGGSNGSATVVASGGTGSYAYSWAPSGGTGATASGLSVGTYTCTIDDSNGCQVTQTFSITQPNAMSASNTQTNVLCSGGNTGSATVTPSGGSSPYTYNWTPSGGTNATASGLAAGSYTCTITDANGCSTTQSVTITQPTAITSSVSAQANVLCNGGNSGSASITAAGGTPGYTYSWAPSGGSAANAGSLTAGIYTCTITDANGCTHTQTLTITQPPALTLTSTGANGCSGSSGIISATAGGGTPAYTYSWSNGLPNGATQTVNPAQTTTYTVTVSDAAGCQNATTVVYTVNPSPTASFTTPAINGILDLDFSTGAQQICVTNNSNGATLYGWTMNGSNPSIQQSPCFTVPDTGDYCIQLIAVSAQNCPDTMEQCITVTESAYSIPNVFTPNGDGTNDAFIVTNHGMKSLHCSIFNRWGQLIYEWDGTTGQWDGKTNGGKLASDGTYYYVVKLVNFAEQTFNETGYLQLIDGK